MNRIPILILFLLLMVSCGEQKPFIRVPFSGVNNAGYSITFKAEKGDTLLLGNGSEIHVPSNAFVDREGKLVEGEVTLNYIEMLDPASILLSGVPLNYGEVEDPSIMESAAMFSLNAFQGQNQLEIADGKSITTVVSSNVEGSEYDFFQLDPEAGNWDNLGNIVPVSNPMIGNLQGNIDSMENKSLEMELVNCFAFNYLENLDVISEDQMDKLKDGRFNYYTWDTAPNMATLKQVVEAKLKSYGVTYCLDESANQEVVWQGRKYNANMMLWESEKDIPGWVMNSEKYRMAELTPLRSGKYLVKFQEWRQQPNWELVTIYSIRASIRMSLEALYSTPPDERSAEYENLLAKMQEEKQLLETQNKVLRTFSIRQLGVYNYDIIKNEERLLVRASVEVDDTPVENNGLDLFVIPKGSNSVIRYDQDQLDHFVVYPDQQLFAFMVTSNNGIALLKEGSLDHLDFQVLANSENPELTVKLETTDYLIHDPIDVSIFLEKELHGMGNMISLR